MPQFVRLGQNSVPTPRYKPFWGLPSSFLIRTAISADSMAPEQQRPLRILACVLCQQRKKKCDRKSPCTFCIKAKIECIPSTPVPKLTRRKPTKELLARLERCEELIKRCNCVQKSLMYDALATGTGSASSSPADSSSSPPPESEKMNSSSDERHQALYQ